jgi:hypothetical protein
LPNRAFAKIKSVTRWNQSGWKPVCSARQSRRNSCG